MIYCLFRDTFLMSFMFWDKYLLKNCLKINLFVCLYLCLFNQTFFCHLCVCLFHLETLIKCNQIFFFFCRKVVFFVFGKWFSWKVNSWKVNYFLMFGSVIENELEKHFLAFGYVMENDLENNLLMFYCFFKFIKKMKIKSDR